MFENLTDKLQRVFKSLRGQGTLTEENIQEAMREIRVAMLEADVNLNVVRELIEHIRAKAVGTEVMTALSPSEQVIKIVRDELIDLLGKDTARFKFAPQPPTVILMAGLQGSGKTTTSGKLAAWLKRAATGPSWSLSTSTALPRASNSGLSRNPLRPKSTKATRRASPPGRRWWRGWLQRPAVKRETSASTR